MHPSGQIKRKFGYFQLLKQRSPQDVMFPGAPINFLRFLLEKLKRHFDEFQVVEIGKLELAGGQDFVDDVRKIGRANFRRKCGLFHDRLRHFCDLS